MVITLLPLGADVSREKFVAAALDSLGNDNRGQRPRKAHDMNVCLASLVGLGGTSSEERIDLDDVRTQCEQLPYRRMSGAEIV